MFLVPAMPLRETAPQMVKEEPRSPDLEETASHGVHGIVVIAMLLNATRSLTRSSVKRDVCSQLLLVSKHKLTYSFLVDLYEPFPEQTSSTAGADQDGAADERLAEEFRQQFLEDVAERQLRKKKAASQAARPGTEEVLKGPKLGGSRNARAQMRDLLLKKEKEGKK
jgi:hypothetical protein